MNTSSSSGMGSLLCNIIPNPQEDLKGIITRSGVTLAGPSFSPPPPSKMVDRELETITAHVLTGSTNNVPPLVVQPSPASTFSTPISSSKMTEVTKDTVQPSTKNIQPLVAQTQVPIDEPVVAPKPKLTIPYPSRANKQKLLIDYVVNPRVPLILGRTFLRTGRALIDVYGQELTLCVDDEAITFKVGQTLKYSYNDAELINRINVIDVACEEYVQEGDILYLEKLLNEDPSPNIPLVKTEYLKQVDATMINPSIDEPPELELKELPSHLEYAFLEGIDKLPIIISRELKDKEKSALLKDDFKPTVQHQRRVNPKIHEVIKKEVIKLIDAGLIYPISNSPWVSPVHCVPKKGGTFQRCMMAIFHDMIEKTMEVFMDDFLVFGNSFFSCLSHLDQMLQRGAENLAIDHLSRLENPDQDELEKKEINKTFPLETLGMIAFRVDSSTPWIALDLEASRAHGFVHRPLELQSLAYGNLIS
uniref:DNA-directed DNA polymerase n=1 Tax=Tanacetum cinerariifolium TaxID=118510 RepID=A0A6L2K7C3_TANCI|nr:DNA-directed DNA polymerase [Tanacetum cinerariifolium]